MLARITFFSCLLCDVGVTKIKRRQRWWLAENHCLFSSAEFVCWCTMHCCYVTGYVNICSDLAEANKWVKRFCVVKYGRLDCYKDPLDEYIEFLVSVERRADPRSRQAAEKNQIDSRPERSFHWSNLFSCKISFPSVKIKWNDSVMYMIDL